MKRYRVSFDVIGEDYPPTKIVIEVNAVSLGRAELQALAHASRVTGPGIHLSDFPSVEAIES